MNAAPERRQEVQQDFQAARCPPGAFQLGRRTAPPDEEVVEVARRANWKSVARTQHVSDVRINLGTRRTVQCTTPASPIPFSMSCRAMGFALEQVMLDFVLEVDDGDIDFVGVCNSVP